MNVSVEHLLKMTQDRPTSEQLNQFYDAIQALPVSDRADLINRLLRESGLGVVFGPNHFSGDLIVQINSMESSQLPDLIRALADRLEHKEQEPK